MEFPWLRSSQVLTVEGIDKLEEGFEPNPRVAFSKDIDSEGEEHPALAG